MSTEIANTATVVQCGSKQLHRVFVVHSFILNVLHRISVTGVNGYALTMSATVQLVQ